MNPSVLVGNRFLRLISTGLALTFLLFNSGHVHALTGQAGWIKIPTDGASFEIYYDPLSIKSEGQQSKRMMTLINYKDNAGKDASMVSETIYNCAKKLKQDQYTLIFEGPWAMGEPINGSLAEEGWRKVLVDSFGINLLRQACK